MTGARLRNLSLAAVITIAVVIGVIALVSRAGVDRGAIDRRPSNVPEDAVPIPYIAKSVLWAKCWHEHEETRCSIFNGAGEALQDDVFVTYAKGTTVPTSGLAIVPERSGPTHLWLKNGEILLPRTNYAEHRRSVEKVIKAFEGSD